MLLKLVGATSFYGSDSQELILIFLSLLHSVGQLQLIFDFRGVLVPHLGHPGVLETLKWRGTFLWFLDDETEDKLLGIW